LSIGKKDVKVGGVLGKRKSLGARKENGIKYDKTTLYALYITMKSII
jgi:hypothetical protein